jgi:peptidoglycan-N-acetylmuramic acid deacetylase
MKRKALALGLAAALMTALLAGCMDNTQQNQNSVPPASQPNTSAANPPAVSGAPGTESTPTTSSAPAQSSMPPNSRATLSTDFSEIGALDRAPITWGPGVRRNAAGRSEACDLLQAAYGHYDALFIGPDEKTVYLTFDQGYENGYTEAILDILKEKGVRAVFFLTGHYLNSAPDLVQRMVDEGHIIGNHSYDHPNYATASAEDAFEDLSKLHEAVYNKWGIAMDLFRFPEGAFSEQALGLIQSTGYTSVFWSYAYNDWNPDSQMEPALALQKALDGAHNGCIYLFHTVGRTNSLILGDLIDGLREQGYQLALIEPMGTPPAEQHTDPFEERSEPEENIFLRPWPSN